MTTTNAFLNNKLIPNTEQTTQMTSHAINNALDQQFRLFILPNCDAEDRCSTWLGALDGKTRVGCGINVLRFMSEIDEDSARQGVAEAEQSAGTPFQVVVNWFNKKLEETQAAYKVIEGKQNINTKENLKGFFDSLFYFLPENSCILIKFNRDPQTPPGLRLSQGHYEIGRAHV